MTRFRNVCTRKASQPMTPLNDVVQSMIDQGYSLKAATTHFQRVYVLRAGIAGNGRSKHTAKLLGVHHNTLTRLLRKVGLPLVQPRRADSQRAA